MEHTLPTGQIRTLRTIWIHKAIPSEESTYSYSVVITAEGR